MFLLIACEFIHWRELHCMEISGLSNTGSSVERGFLFVWVIDYT